MTDLDDPSRTDLAEDRTILANERTFAGWMRASIACAAIGVGLAGLFQKVEPAWLPRSIATVFLITGIVIILLARQRASAVPHRSSAHAIETAQPINLTLLAGVVCLCAAALVLAIWVLKV